MPHLLPRGREAAQPPPSSTRQLGMLGRSEPVYEEHEERSDALGALVYRTWGYAQALTSPMKSDTLMVTAGEEENTVFSRNCPWPLRNLGSTGGGRWCSHGRGVSRGGSSGSPASSTSSRWAQFVARHSSEVGFANSSTRPSTASGRHD